MRCPTGVRNSHQSGRPPTRLNLWVHALKQLRPRPHSFALHPFCTRIFCPTGKSVKTCPAPLRKIFRFRRRANQRYQLAPSFPGKRGGRASSRTWEGMRWTLWRRRVCVRRAVFRERTTARRRTAPKRTAKPCGPDTRCWCQAVGGEIDPTGFDSAIKAAATVTRRIRRGGERGISRKAIARGMPERLR
jgi:hypothetical protein